MTTEIELKYLICESENQDVAKKITEMLTTQKVDFKYTEKQLTNDYFDSKNLDLRKMDIGLRIRSCNGKYEQTIKTAGQVNAGLHQRPEYNVDIETAHIALALFPMHIWPQNYDVLSLQTQLQVLFSTDFTRQAWLINQADNTIELALDRGIISTPLNTETHTINELEIELVRGDQQAIFSLAEQLNVLLNIEVGNLSKAARGYALYYNAV